MASNKEEDSIPIEREKEIAQLPELEENEKAEAISNEDISPLLHQEQVNNNSVLPNTIEHNSVSDKEETPSPLESNKDMPENSEKAIIPIEEVNEKERSINEDYLQAKIDRMHIHKGIASGIVKGLNSSLSNIKETFIDNELHHLPISQSQQDIHSNNLKLAQNKERLRLINELKKNELQLNHQLSQLNHNQTLLENDFYLNLSLPPKANAVNNSVRLYKINSIKKQKEVTIHRLIEVANKIRTLTREETIEDGQFYQSVNANLREFQRDFGRKREGIAKAISTLHKESLLRQKKMSDEIEHSLALRIEEIEMKEKQSEQRRMVLILQMRQQEREAIAKRHLVNSTKAQRTSRMKGNANQYSYINLSSKYAEKQSDYIKENIKKRKAYMKLIDTEELSDFSNQIAQAKERKEEDNLAKATKLKQLWLERSKMKPDYVSPLAYKRDEEEAKEKELQEERKLLLENNRENRIKFSNSITKPKPSLRETVRENDLLYKDKAKLTPIQSSHSLQLAKLEVKPKIFIKKKALIKEDKPKEKEATPPKPRIEQPDYLLEKRKSRSPSKEKPIDWNEEFIKEKDKSSLMASMLSIQAKSKQMDEKIRMKKLILNVNERIGSDAKFCEEMSNLMINSIKAKLSILNNTDNKVVNIH